MNKESHKTLRIGLIIPSLDVGGSEKHVIKLANLLNLKGIHVSIIILSRNINSHLISEIASGISVQKFLGNPINKILLTRKTIRDFDLNCAIGFLNLGNVMMLFLPRELIKIATIRNIPSYSIRNILKNSLLKLSYTISDLIITNNTYLVSKKLSSKLIYIPNTVATKNSVMVLNPPKNDKINIITCSNLRPVKGLVEYCQKLCELDSNTKSKIRITIIGRGPLEKQIKEILAKSEIEFILKSNIYDVSKELINADIYVHPSLSEGFSNSILEAMSHRLPVISTNVGSAETQLGSKQFLYEPKSKSDQLLKLLCVFVKNQSLRLEEGSKNMDRAIKDFSEEKMSLGYAEAFKRVGFEL
jgi:glycosyltransferase involved in cell wall biosynthesis